MIDDTIAEPKTKAKSAYSKRYPTDCKDKTPNTKHMLNDKNVNIKLYSIFQQYSYAVEIIDEDTGKRIRTETRVNKEGFPTKKQLGIMLGEEKVQADGTTKTVPMSQPTVRKYWNYLLNPSEENQYCPYVIEKDEYYILPERESKFSLIPASIVHFMNKFCSPEEMKTYLFLYSMNHWFHHKMAERRKAMPPEMVEWETKEKDCFVFTLKEVACNIGINITNWDVRQELWGFDIERFENDPKYQLGIIPLALLGLKNKGLIDWAETVSPYGHTMYVLLEVNTDARKVVKTKHIGYSKKVETDRKVSEDTIIDHGIPTKTKTVTHTGEPGHISNGMSELLARLQANAQKNN